MSVIKSEDIIGFEVGEQIVCKSCITPEETNDLKQADIITTKDEEDFIFCDRCEESL